MRDGRIFCAGAPEDVVTEKGLRTMYGVEAGIV